MQRRRKRKQPEGVESKSAVVFQPSGQRVSAGNGKTIQEVARELGIGIKNLCGGRGVCGKCRVRIQEGGNLSPMGEDEEKLLGPHQHEGYRLACQARIHGDVVVFIPEESRVEKQLVRKTAREIAIELKPAVKKYYVRVPPAHTG